MAPIVRDTGAGFLVDPTDPTAIAAAITSLVTDPTRRAELAGKALTAAHATYNWETQANELLAEYGRLTGRQW